MKTIKFEIVTPERVLLKEEIAQITVSTRDGEITILPNHIPLVSVLKPGVAEVKKTDNTVSVLSITGGFIEVSRDKIIILADAAEHAAEIDLARAEEARRRAEETMKERVDKETFTAVSAELARALARTKAVKRWKKLQNLK